MYIACHAWAYDNVNLHEAIGTIARLGFRAVDIGSGPHFNLGEVAQDPAGHAASIRQITDDFNMEIADVYLVMTHINSPDPATRNTRLRLFDRLLTFAQALDAGGVTISPGIVHQDRLEHSFARAIPCLQYMSDVAQSRQIRLSFEPHLDSIAPNPKSAAQLMQAIPSLTMTLDIAHWVAQGISWKAIEPMLDHTSHIQLRQAANNKLQTPFDQGKIDITQLLESLDNHGYEGGISIEYMNAVGWHGMMEVDVTREIATMRDALRETRSIYRGK